MRKLHVQDHHRRARAICLSTRKTRKQKKRKKKKGGHNLDRFIYYTTTTTTSASKPNLPPPQRKKKTFQNFERTNGWWMMTHMIILSTRLFPKKKNLNCINGVVVCRCSSVWLQHTRGYFFAKFQQQVGLVMSKICVDIYLFILCLFSFDEFVFGWKPHPTHMGKKY